MADDAKRNGLIEAIRNVFGQTEREVKHTDQGPQGKPMESAVGCAEQHTDRNGNVISCEEWRRLHPEQN